MDKPALLCLCLGLLAGCQAPAERPGPPPPQLHKRDAAAQVFFRHLHYPYYASKARRRRIERIVRGLDPIQTPTQVLAELGPPDWKEEVDGYPPKIPPAEIWYYAHTLERPLGPNYDGKLLIIHIAKTTRPEIESFTDRGIQRVGR